MILVTGQHVVISPEKVVLTYNIAGLASRIWAKVIDIILYFALMTGLGNLLALFGGAIPDLNVVVTVVISLLLIFGFFGSFIIQEILMNGQTVGKKALGLRTVMIDGLPITPLAAFYRNTILFADLFLPFVGVAMIFLNEKGQRVGDLAAGTIVVHQPLRTRAVTMSPHRYGTHPHEVHVGALKGVTMEEYLAIKRLCDRFPELPPAIQSKSIEEIWVPFAERFGIPTVPGVHPIYLMEATVMKYGRMKNLV